MITLKVYVVLLIAVSLITFVVYAIDKLKEVNGAWRIPETTLLLFSLFLGGIGGYTAMFVTRHKTRKWYFHCINVVGILWQVALLIFLIVVEIKGA